MPLWAQQTIHVPADAATIQSGINVASDGDTVLVAPGTYVENIDFKGKAITVTSSGGATTTTIDGGQKGIVVRFGNNETRASVINGFNTSVGEFDPPAPGEPAIVGRMSAAGSGSCSACHSPFALSDNVV